MQFPLKKTITRVTVLSALLPALPWLSQDVFAHDRPIPTSKLDPSTAPPRGSYAYSSFGPVVRSGFTAECVATGTWTAEGATPDCHGAFFASPVKPAPTTAAASAAPADPAAAAAPEAYEAAQYSEPPVPAAEAAETGANVAASGAQSAATGTEAAATEAEAAAAGSEVAAGAAAVVGAAAVAGVSDFAGEGDASDMAPVPAAESFAADTGDQGISDPVMYYDEDVGSAAEETILGVTQFGDDDSGIVPDDGIAGRQLYTDEAPTGDDGIVSRQSYDEGSGGVADDGIVSRQLYDEDAGDVADDGIVARQFYDDAAAADDDGIVSRQTFDDASAAADDGIVSRQTFDDASAAADDGIVARQLYDEEAEVGDDGILGREEYFTEDNQAAEEDLISEPKVYADEGATVAQTEEPAKPQPATKPVVLPVTITLEAEPLFDFDRSAVRANERVKLDSLVEGLKGVNYDSIVVVGHADRIGTKRYNQRLSQRRATAVKAYLVNKGVGDARIQTEGRGEMEPLTDAKTCHGLHKQKLISCLQPDRRVEVTVTGKKPQQ
jgi:outer membrane protein OmpA-like peptidoglycan-associated protein